MRHLASENPLNLLQYAAQASFDSYNNQHDPLCLPDTRIEVLTQITAWADGDNGRCIFWLNGMAGTGKSTIARTVAHKCSEQRRLGASFFFSRDSGDVNHAGKFFASIAVQLATISDVLSRYICEAIQRQRDIANKGLRDQWKQLVYEPLSKMEAQSLTSPLLLVIDALDECDDDKDIELILQLLAEARELRKIRLRVFLTSRAEKPIRNGFRKIPEAEHQDFILHNISPSVIENDLSIFLYSELEEIRQAGSLPTDWPGEENTQLLIKSASGLFIYVATACRFLKDSMFPDESFPLVLHGDFGDSSPLERLDQIYTQVLKSSIWRNCHEGNKKERKERSDLFRQVIGPLIILFDPLSSAALSTVLGLQSKKTKVLLELLHSVLNVPESLVAPVRLLHPSFRDFLLDKQRCQDELFWVDEKETHRMLAVSCLRLMSEHLNRDICGLHSPGALATEVHGDQITKCLPKELQYACRYWVEHLRRSEACLSDNIHVHHFLQKHFLHWLEALALMRKISDGAAMLSALESILTVSD
jgi:hypothetical protein